MSFGFGFGIGLSFGLGFGFGRNLKLWFRSFTNISGSEVCESIEKLLQNIHSFLCRAVYEVTWLLQLLDWRSDWRLFFKLLMLKIRVFLLCFKESLRISTRIWWICSKCPNFTKLTSSDCSTMGSYENMWKYCQSIEKVLWTTECIEKYMKVLKSMWKYRVLHRFVVLESLAVLLSLVVFKSIVIL